MTHSFLLFTQTLHDEELYENECWFCGAEATSQKILVMTTMSAPENSRRAPFSTPVPGKSGAVRFV